MLIFLSYIASEFTIWIITTTYKSTIFSFSFNEIMTASWTFSFVENYVFKPKMGEVTNIGSTSPRNSKSTRQFFASKLYHYPSS